MGWDVSICDKNGVVLFAASYPRSRDYHVFNDDALYGDDQPYRESREGRTFYVDISFVPDWHLLAKKTANVILAVPNDPNIQHFWGQLLAVLWVVIHDKENSFSMSIG